MSAWNPPAFTGRRNIVADEIPGWWIFSAQSDVAVTLEEVKDEN